MAASAACGGTDDDGELVVFAAASLTESFTALGEEFGSATGVEVTFNFAGSSELAAQLLDGAPGDVFASADLPNIDRVADAGLLADEPVVFATNLPTIVVERGNPLGIEDLADLADPDLVVVLCAPEVPCGAYASQTLEAVGVTVTPDSYEGNVKGVVTKVALGEADAGIAYRTDALAAAADVDEVVLPDLGVVAEYPVAVVAGTDRSDDADAFLAYLRSDTGRDVLERFGFDTP